MTCVPLPGAQEAYVLPTASEAPHVLAGTDIHERYQTRCLLDAGDDVVLGASATLERCQVFGHYGAVTAQVPRLHTRPAARENTRYCDPNGVEPGHRVEEHTFWPVTFPLLSS